MRQCFRKTPRWALILVALLVLAGCIERKVQPRNYFALMTMKQLGDNQQISALPDLGVGIGPVTIPQRLKRQQIATRSADNQYTFNDLNQWAGSLEDDIAMVMGENLAQLLGIERVTYFPWRYHGALTYQIEVNVQYLDADLNGAAVLVARWTIRAADSHETLAAGKIDQQQPLSAASYAALTKAQSQLLAVLSKELAEILKNLTQAQRSNQG
ncbi:MAG: membrane integrity-associated transporter subunit PqiC [Deltaproteobacteria bacterium]|nr:membrane integrity-associated transporter subunit PqiC [Deltaproteobacteria bacterium]NCP02160.1 membrane integrity-associated transporter subunit PqiC [Deltaproteobacteria bacterium]